MIAMPTCFGLHYPSARRVVRLAPPCARFASSVELCTHGFTNADPWVHDMEMMKVGIREFRADLADYIASSRPIAVTRHGQTVGYFIPSEGREEGDLAALQKANQALGQLLSEQGIDAEEIVSEFKAARKQAGARRKAGAA